MEWFFSPRWTENDTRKFAASAATRRCAEYMTARHSIGKRASPATRLRTKLLTASHDIASPLHGRNSQDLRPFLTNSDGVGWVDGKLHSTDFCLERMGNNHHVNVCQIGDPETIAYLGKIDNFLGRVEICGCFYRRRRATYFPAGSRRAAEEVAIHFRDHRPRAYPRDTELPTGLIRHTIRNCREILRVIPRDGLYLNVSPWARTSRKQVWPNYPAFAAETWGSFYT